MRALPLPKVLNLDASELRARIADGLNIRCLLDGLDERPLTAAIMSSRDRGTWIEQRIALRDAAADDVQALLLLPKGTPRPRPAVIGLHGHGDSAEIFAQHFMGSDLARRGFVVLLPEFRVPDENEASLSLLRSGRTLMGRRIYETLLMIKHLRSLPEVDRRRIGMISHSGGSSAANIVVRLTDWVTAQVSDHEVDYSRNYDGTVPRQGQGKSGVHCETIPALYPLSATINNKLSLRIPRLNVEYGFHPRSTRKKISDFIIKPSMCSMLQPPMPSSCVDRAQWALDVFDGKSSLMYLNIALRAKPGKSDLRRIAVLCEKLGGFHLSLNAATLMDVCPSLGLGFWFARVEEAARNGDNAKALETLAKVENLTAKADDLRRIRWIYQKLKKPRLAFKALSALARMRPDDAGLRLELAEAAMRIGDKAAALKTLAGVENLTVKADDLRRVLWIYQKLKEPRLAFKALSALARMRPDDAGLRLELAEAAMRIGDKAAALETLARVENLTVKADDLRRTAWIYQKLEEPHLAFKALSALASLSPDDAGLQLGLAEAAMRIGDKAAALKFLSRVDESTEKADDLRRTAWICQKLEEPRLAFKALSALARMRPNDAGLRLELAEAAARIGDKTAALESFRQADVAARTDEDRHRVALGYQELGQYRRALGILRQLARRHPLNASLFNDLGICEHRAGFPGDAILHLRQAISLDPSELPVYLTLGSIYISQGRLKSALTLYDAALNIAAGRPELDETLNRIRLSRNEILAQSRPQLQRR